MALPPSALLGAKEIAKKKLRKLKSQGAFGGMISWGKEGETRSKKPSSLAIQIFLEPFGDLVLELGDWLYWNGIDEVRIRFALTGGSDYKNKQKILLDLLEGKNYGQDLSKRLNLEIEDAKIFGADAGGAFRFVEFRISTPLKRDPELFAEIFTTAVLYFHEKLGFRAGKRWN